MDHHPDIDLRWRTVRLTCSTHSAGGVTQFDIELAHRIQVAASGAGAKVPLRRRAAGSWRSMWWIPLRCGRSGAGTRLRQVPVPDGTIELQDPAGIAPRLWFQPMEPPRTGRDRFHVDVYRSLDDEAGLAGPPASRAAGW